MPHEICGQASKWEVFCGQEGKHVNLGSSLASPCFHPLDMVTQDVMSRAVAAILQPHGEGLDSRE